MSLNHLLMLNQRLASLPLLMVANSAKAVKRQLLKQIGAQLLVVLKSLLHQKPPPLQEAVVGNQWLILQQRVLEPMEAAVEANRLKLLPQMKRRIRRWKRQRPPEGRIRNRE